MSGVIPLCVHMNLQKTFAPSISFGFLADEMDAVVVLLNWSVVIIYAALTSKGVGDDRRIGIKGGNTTSEEERRKEKLQE